jgi:hypothetical protein
MAGSNDSGGKHGSVVDAIARRMLNALLLCAVLAAFAGDTIPFAIVPVLVGVWLLTFPLQGLQMRWLQHTARRTAQAESATAL